MAPTFDPWAIAVALDAVLEAHLGGQLDENTASSQVLALWSTVPEASRREVESLLVRRIRSTLNTPNPIEA
jgi:hypothetical protein